MNDEKIATVGFIGLGNIGKPMAKNLTVKGIAKGLTVNVYDVVDAPVQELVGLGASAATPKEMAGNCSVIGLCVRDDKDVDDLLYGEEGMLANAGPGTVIAVHSTVLRDNVLRWAKDAKAKGIELIDAPITGGAAGAEAATLCIMVGGEESVIERARSYFDCMSTTLVHGGEIGNGIVLKLANNLVTYAEYTAASEAVGLVKSAGIAAEKFFQVGQANGVLFGGMLQFITGREALLASCTPEEVESIMGHFATLGQKDLDHAMVLAGELGLDLPQGEAVRSGIRKTFLKGV